MKEPYRTFNMSTKKIFDDSYLYLRKINMKFNSEIDEINGLPVQSYKEISSQYWN